MKKIRIEYICLLTIFLCVGFIAFVNAAHSIGYLEENSSIVGSLLMLSSLPHIALVRMKKERKIFYLILGGLGIVLGAVAMYVHSIALNTICLIWGIFDICRSSFEIVDASFEIKDKKWFAFTEIGVSSFEIVIATLLIIDRFEGIKLHFLAIGIAFFVYLVKYLFEMILELKKKEE